MGGSGDGARRDRWRDAQRDAGGPAAPKVTVGASVAVAELEAIPWATNGKNGVAYRAKSITPVNTTAAAKA